MNYHQNGDHEVFKGDFIVDVRAGYFVGKNDEMKISFIVKNLTNHEYSLRPGLIDAPRNYTVRFDFKFGGRPKTLEPTI